MKALHPYFKTAIQASQNSSYHQPMGAAVYFKNKFIASGFNSLKTHPFMFYRDGYTIHAEIHALIKAKSKRFDLKGTSIFVYRGLKSGDTGLARPCDICMDMIYLEGIKNVFYTDYHNEWERIKV